MLRCFFIPIVIMLAFAGFPSMSHEAENSNSMARYVLPSWGNGAPTIVISLPKGYERETKKPADFDLHYLNNKNLVLPGILLYVGHHPNLFSSNISQHQQKKRSIAIAGHEEEWVEWTSEGKCFGEVLLSKLFPDNKSYGALIVHISINAATEKDLHEAEQWFSTISLVPQK